MVTVCLMRAFLLVSLTLDVQLGRHPVCHPHSHRPGMYVCMYVCIIIATMIIWHVYHLGCGIWYVWIFACSL